ncbi:MAG: colanic acid/amylovoran biosynthesis glycosyltransferase [Planctomycetota bacterium]|jgi:colanic acid/amylovoran biosynthesis glycosyltransferase
MTAKRTSGRIAYLLKKFPRLSETFVLNEILGQEQLGRDIVIFSRREADDEPRHPELERLRAPIETLPSRREIDPWQTLFLSDWEAPEELFMRVGKLVRSARTWGHPRFASLLVEALYLLSRTREVDVQHVHAHFATDSAMVAMLLHELGGPGYSITAHAKDIYRSTVDDELLSRMFSNAEFVVTVCDANVEALGARLSEPAMAKLRRLYNGIDLSSYVPTFEGREENHVLAIGRLVEKKGFDVLLDALRLMADEGISFRASIVGQGDQEQLLRQRIVDLALTDRVELLGPRDQDEVRSIMRRATLFCLPCIIGADGNRDALPTVLLEALASGLPCISTPVTGIPEILGEGQVGDLVPENDPARTAQAMTALLQNKQRRLDLARAGRHHAEQLFDRDKIAQVLSGWFDEALKPKSAPCESFH